MSRLLSKNIKIGDIVIPYWKGSKPVEVTGLDGVFVITEGGMRYFHSEIKIDTSLSRDNKIDKILGNE